MTDIAVTGANGVAPDGQGPVGGPLAVAPSALAKKLISVLRNAPGKPAPVVLVRAAPDWPYDPVLALDGGREARVSACVSAPCGMGPARGPRRSGTAGHPHRP